MNILIDTHIFIWSLYEPDKLSSEIISLLEHTDNCILVSVATFWETVIKHKKYNEDFPYTGDELYKQALDSGFNIVPIDAQDVLEVDSLQYPSAGVKLHCDPFDRIMLAQAKNRNYRFLTVDKLIHNYSEPCVLSVK